MTVKPINFKPYQVRAALRGGLSQTRMVLSLPVVTTTRGQWEVSVVGGAGIVNDSGCPYPERACVWHTYDGTVVLPPYEVGDLLYVRESFATHPCAKGAVHQKGDGHPWGSPIYKATFGAALSPVCEGFTAWKPSIHMPKWASRLTLEVTNVRVQRVRDISRGDVMEEGCPFPNMARGPNPVDWFCDLWDSLHGEGAWDRNDWVCAVSFRCIQKNIEEVLNGREAKEFIASVKADAEYECDEFEASEALNKIDTALAALKEQDHG